MLTKGQGNTREIMAWYLKHLYQEEEMFHWVISRDLNINDALELQKGKFWPNINNEYCNNESNSIKL